MKLVRSCRLLSSAAVRAAFSEAVALLFAFGSFDVSSQSRVWIRFNPGACRRDGIAGSPVAIAVVFGVRVV